jgi:hypothetical protein
MGLLCDRSGKSRCTDQKLQSSATDANLRFQGPELSPHLRFAPARAKPLRRPQRVRDRTRLPNHD